MHVITVQETLEDVVADVLAGTVASERVWVARRLGETLEYYDFETALVDGEVQFSSKSDDVTLTKSGRHLRLLVKGESYALEMPSTKRSCTNASAVAITDSSLLLGKSSGEIVQYSTATQQVEATMLAHYLAVLQLVVFPSNKAFLSVGDDLRMQIWLLEGDERTPTRTFVHQKKPVSGVALVGRGRNFLSASLDGSVDLWECGSGSVVSTFRRIDNLSDPATCLAVATSEQAAGQASANPLLFDCDNAVLFVGYELGTIQQYSVAGHHQTPVRYKLAAAVTSLAVAGDIVVAGHANGEIIVYDKNQRSLQLDAEHSVDNLWIESAAPLTIVASNGPEVLLRIVYTGSFTYTYLVGLSEMARVQLVAGRGGGVVVATSDNIAFY